ncbi:MAG: Spy/CpxP family protein refolding chaperone [Kofleriaceae bacterium]
MICLAIGLGALGFFALRRARYCHHGHGHGWRGGWYGHHHGRHTRRRWMLRGLFMRLDATPAQERAIVAELDKLEDRVRAARVGVVDARGDLSAALRGSELDDAALGAVLGRFDGSIAEARGAAIDALRAIHAVLDDKQRAMLADMLDRRGGWWRNGPYR